MKNLKLHLSIALLSLFFNLNAQTLNQLIPSGFTSNEAILVDFENDGDLDIVLTNTADDEIYALINDSEKTFPKTIIQNTGVNFNINDIQTADIDNDGDPDFIVASGEDPFSGPIDGELYWLQNQGDGTFNKLQIDTGYKFENIAIADFNNDGLLDFACTYNLGTNLYTLNSFFNFTTSVIDNSDENDDFLILAEDANFDGNIDLIISGSGVYFPEDSLTTGSRILANDGSANFSDFEFLRVKTTTTTSISRALKYVDLNGDGIKDLLAQTSAGLGGLYFNDAVNSFDDKFTLLHKSNIDCGGDIAVFDIDGNGFKDIVRHEICNSNEVGKNHLYILSQYATMEFDTIILEQDFNSNFTDLVVGDLDGDGDEDLVTTERNNNEKICWWENINGTLNRHIIYGKIPKSLATKFADIDGDGDQDILATSSKFGSEEMDDIILFENKGNDLYSNWRILDGFDGVFEADFADINNDGNLDIVASATEDNELVWLENTGTIYDWTKHIIDNTATDSKGITITDIDNDNNIDVINAHSDGIVLYKNNLYGNSFTAIKIDSISQDITKVKVADMDNDDDMDLVAISDDDISSILYYENLGTTLSFSKNIILTGEQTRDVGIADLNDDGFLDIFAAFKNYFNKDVVAYYGDGTGSFPTVATLADEANETTAVTAADLDSDGDLDILYGTNSFVSGGPGSGGHLYLLDNLGSGIYDTKVLLATTFFDGTILDISVADSNNDTSMDIVLSDRKAEMIYLITFPGIECIADLNLTGYVVSNNYISGNSITAQNAIIPSGALTIFNSKEYILLDIGFEVPANADFEIIIDGCGN